MKIENVEVWGFEHAIRGMRNPMNSWDKSDSGYIDKRFNDQFHIGNADMKLMKSLISLGPTHRKFLRQIFISVDITAPLYWWKEFDTYKVGTVANSCSTMHKLKDTPITVECFEMDDFSIFETDSDVEESINSFEFWNLYLIPYLEKLRALFNETKDKKYWKELIRMLPESWLQKRTVTMNYENAYSMWQQRKCHKLDEWSDVFCDDFIEELPYFKELFID